MKFSYLILFLSLFFVGCQENSQQKEDSSDKTDTQQQKFAIALHGGAGEMNPNDFPDSIQQKYKAKLKEAVKAGQNVLKNDGSAVEAVQATIIILENSPLFNAGKGAVLNQYGKPELDASIMDGKTKNAGAVASVKHIKNPINLATAILENSNHVLLSGKGAEEFALTQKTDTVPQDYFITKKRLKQLQNIQKKDGLSANYDSDLKDEKLGTVGCVALDKQGNLAAGTSTGGLINKSFGRVGDSPIIGAGTYANNKTVAVSSTGEGEYYIRDVVAYDISALIEYADFSVVEATQKVIHEKQPEIGGSGGVIAMDNYGNISFEFNTSGMFRAQMNAKDEVKVGIFEDDFN